MSMHPPAQDCTIIESETSVTVEIPSRPISLQASGDAKRALQEKIRNAKPGFSYFFTGDIRVEIDWYVTETERYESTLSPDLDNIVKPLLDAVTGPGGCIFDDGQVQALNIGWLTGINSVGLTLRISANIPDDRMSKDGLVFVEIRPSLCMPLNANLPKELREMAIEALDAMWGSYEKLRKEGLPHEVAKMVLSVQRPFHKHRVREFTVLSTSEFIHYS